MYPAERIQHALLILSFVVLAWTGFALRYPAAWWAWPLIHSQSQWNLRGNVHRVAAIVFVALSFAHAATLIASRRLRDHWKGLLPKHRDISEALLNFYYNVGILPKPPALSSHSYIEKMEYWALVWGAVVMSVTGVLLWANTLVMRVSSKLVLDVATAIHYYEAVLATLAIIVWHFYYVIFDPSVYPVDPALFTGYSVRERQPDGDGH
jgi:cytochrome b subunit of formate dehydrogenase